jgi:hypothetical protein
LGGTSHLPWFGCALALLLIQQLAIRRIGTAGLAGGLRRTLFLATTVALMALALRYRRFLGAWLIAAGIGLNLLPMMAHGGLMPVSYRVVHDSGAFPEITEADIGQQLGNGKDVLLRDDDIQLAALSDRYALSVPLYGSNIYSPGDFVLFAGVGVVVLQAAGGAALPAFRRRSAVGEGAGTR